MSDPEPIAGPHAGHHITWNERTLRVFDVVGVDHAAERVVTKPCTYDDDEDEDPFLYCETCGENLDAIDLREAGISPDYIVWAPE